VQTGVFVFSLFQEGQVGVGVLPEGEQILIGGASARSVAGESERAGKFETAEDVERGHRSFRK
jgi:hypothetical protein